MTVRMADIFGGGHAIIRGILGDSPSGFVRLQPECLPRPLAGSNESHSYFLEISAGSTVAEVSRWIYFPLVAFFDNLRPSPPGPKVNTNVLNGALHTFRCMNSGGGNGTPLATVADAAEAKPPAAVPAFVTQLTAYRRKVSAHVRPQI